MDSSRLSLTPCWSVEHFPTCPAFGMPVSIRGCERRILLRLRWHGLLSRQEPIPAGTEFLISSPGIRQPTFQTLRLAVLRSLKAFLLRHKSLTTARVYR